MKKLLITFPENLSSALGYTLLHSLWQGAAVLLIFWLISLGVKQAKHRYNLAIGGLVSMLVISLITFFYLYKPAESTYISESTHLIYSDAEYTGTSLIYDSQNWLDSTLLFINTYIDQIAVLWVLGVSFLLVRMSLSLVFIEKLKRSAQPVIERKTLELMKGIQERIGISRLVKLVESADLQSPVTVGWLKPVILFPVGMLTGLNVQHIEAILAHELAHIKRSDYLINILQNFAEVLFFFNPFIWILSSKVRIERENCCDDIAMEICGNRLVVAKALVQVADYAVHPQLAMAFAKKEDTLMVRIKRIAGVRQSGYFNSANLLGVLFVMSLFFGGVVYAKEEILKEEITEIETENQEVKSDIIQPVISQNPAVKMNSSGDTLDAQMGKLQKEIQLLSDEIQKYSGRISGISSRMEGTHIKEIEKLSKQISEKAKNIEGPVDEQQELALKMMELDLESRKLDRRKDLEAGERAKMQKQIAEKREVIEKSKEASHAAIRNLQSEIGVLQEKIAKEQAPIAKMQEEISKNHKPIDSLSKIIQLKGEKMRELGEKKRIAVEKSMNNFVQALVSSGVVSDVKDFKLEILGDNLKINGENRSSSEFSKVWDLLYSHFSETEYLEGRDIKITKKGEKLSWRFKNGNVSYMNNWSSDF